MNKAFASIATLLLLLREKKISVRELVEFYHDRFLRYDDQLKTAIEIFDIDSIINKIATQDMQSKLYGIPGLIKDNICMKGRIASCASKILSPYHAPYDATVIKKLSSEGALFIGRANMDEFAMGSSNENSSFASCKNPWNHSKVPGGSSGGSIAAVAAGLIPWSLGSETGGSVRQPAALCGIVGSKPTYGLVSRYGLIAYASSLDQVGVATRTVYDNALILSILAGNDEKDGTSTKNKQFDFVKDLTGVFPSGIRIGVLDNALYAQGNDPEMVQLLEDAIVVLEKLGAKIAHISLPSMEYSAATYFVISRAELASNLARFDGVRYGRRSPGVKNLEELYEKSRGEGFGKEVKTRIMLGNYVLSKGHADQYYNQAKKIQMHMKNEFEKSFQEVDLIFSPISPSAAFSFGEMVDDVKLDLQDYFTCSANLTGIPAVSVPCGFTKENLPIGYQLMGPNYSEGLIFQVLHAYEQNTEWHHIHPSKYTE